MLNFAPLRFSLSQCMRLAVASTSNSSQSIEDSLSMYSAFFNQIIKL